LTATSSVNWARFSRRHDDRDGRRALGGGEGHVLIDEVLDVGIDDGEHGPRLAPEQAGRARGLVV